MDVMKAFHGGHEGNGGCSHERKIINGKELKNAYGDSRWNEDQHEREEREHKHYLFGYVRRRNSKGAGSN